MVRPSAFRWVLANMVGFACAGVLIRLLVPAAAVLGGLVGLIGGPGMLLSTLAKAPDLLVWQMELVGAVAAGSVCGVIIGGITGFTQAWVLGWQGHWVEATLKGGLFGGLMAGLVCGGIANMSGFSWDIGLPLDWIFRRSPEGIVALAAMGSIVGYGTGAYQQQAFEQSGYQALGWSGRAAAFGMVAWALSGIYGETLLWIMGTAPESILLDLEPGASALGTMRSAFEPLVATVANLMIVGMTYGLLSAGRVRAIVASTAAGVMGARSLISGRVILFIVVGCGIIQVVTMAVAIGLLQR